MSTPIAVTHRGITIIYLEGNNEWTCEEFARKGSPSLSTAKERIDKILDQKEKKPFTRFKAWIKEVVWNSTWEEVEVTGITEDQQEAWIVDSEKKRRKIGRNYGPENGTIRIYPSTAENTATIGQVLEIAAQRDKLNEQVSKLEASLTPYKPE